MSDWLRGILGSILVGGAAAALVTALLERAPGPAPVAPAPAESATGCREKTSPKYETTCEPGQVLTIEAFGDIHVVVCRCPSDAGAPEPTRPR